MAKRFVHFKTKVNFNAATLGTDYTNDSIVFINDSQEIWTHGQFFAIPEAYKTKITNLETAVSALQAAQGTDFALRKVSDGTNTYIASNGKETLNLRAGAHTNVTVDPETGNVTIASTLTPSSYFPNASGTALETKVAELEAAKYDVVGANAVTVTEAEGVKTVGLKLDNSGDITFTDSEAGLKATIADVDTLVPVNGLKAGDKVLKLEGKKLSATVALSVDSTADTDGKKYIRLTGVDGADLGKIDIAEFVKDGMVDTVKFDDATKMLTITFNTAAGKDAVDVDLTSLVDTYDGANVKLKTIAYDETEAVEPAAGDTLDSVVINLVKRDRELKAELDKINSDIRDVQSGSLVSIEKGTDGKFVTTTVSAKSNNKQQVSVAVKTDVAIADATAAADGLATAYAVKSYVDDLFAWDEKD